jgi:hypothetical protein
VIEGIEKFGVEESVPVAGIVRGPWLETVLEQSESGEKSTVWPMKFASC